MNDWNPYTENNSSASQNAEKNNRNPYSTSGSYSAGQSAEGGNNYGDAYQRTSYEPGPQATSNTLSIVSLVLGILSLAGICCCGSSLLFGIGAVVCALVRRKKRGTMDGMAIAGLVMGIIGGVFGLAALLVSWLAFDGGMLASFGNILGHDDILEYYLY